jgi:hypothetical protein
MFINIESIEAIIQNPYNNKSNNIIYNMTNKVLTFINLKNLENFFIDFNFYTFPKYAKILFSETQEALEKNDQYIIKRTLNPVYFEVKIIYTEF